MLCEKKHLLKLLLSCSKNHFWKLVFITLCTSEVATNMFRHRFSLVLVRLNQKKKCLIDIFKTFRNFSIRVKTTFIYLFSFVFLCQNKQKQNPDTCCHQFWYSRTTINKFQQMFSVTFFKPNISISKTTLCWFFATLCYHTLPASASILAK